MTEKNMEMKERLRRVVNWLIAQGKAGSQRELAKVLGYNASAFSQVINGHVPLSDKFLRRLSAFEPRLNIEWVRNGSGAMLAGEEKVVEAEPIDDGEMEFYTENTKGCRFYKKGDQLYMTVRHVPYAAFGQFANESDRLEPNDEDWGEETYEVDRVAHGHYLSFEVKGDSMDVGTRQSFEAGDRVLVRELEREHWRDRIRFDDHPFWVVVFGSSVLIKQMIAQDRKEGLLTFHSLNPSPEYADFTISEDEIRNLYYVIRKKPRERAF
jgi:transcriptional regulator with XRE-family HTH domain